VIGPISPDSPDGSAFSRRRAPILAAISIYYREAASRTRRMRRVKERTGVFTKVSVAFGHVDRIHLGNPGLDRGGEASIRKKHTE
jgi:hypothetical protein